MSFRLTYATMFDPPPEMHERFDAALVTVRSMLGGRHSLFLNGVDTAAVHYVSHRSPIDSDIQLGEFAVATEQDGARCSQQCQSRFTRDDIGTQNEYCSAQAFTVNAGACQAGA